MRRLRMLMATGGAAILAFCMSAGSGHADPNVITDNMYPTAAVPAACFGTTTWSSGTNCQQQDGYVDIFAVTRYSGWSAPTADFVEAWSAYHYDSTDLAIVPATFINFDGPYNSTDVILDQNPLSIVYDGFTFCRVAETSIDCDMHTVLIKATSPSPNVICHELGHALGLMHGVSANPALSNTDSRLGCMVTPVPTYNPAIPLGPGLHNIGMINQTY